MTTTYEIPEAAIHVTMQHVLDGLTADAMEVTFAELLNEFHGTLEEKHAQTHTAQTTPAGNAWPPLAPRTVKRKGHSTILVETGRLKASLAGRSGDSIREVVDEGPGRAGLSFGTDVEYAHYHQDGTTRIPQREHVGASEELIDQFAEAIATTFTEQLKAKA